MSTITIERFSFNPAAGTYAATGESRSLKEWGLAPATISTASWTMGQLTLSARGAGPALAAPIFGYRDKLVVWENGTRIWQGIVVSPTAQLQREQAQSYRVVDPTWWLTFAPASWGFLADFNGVTSGAWLYATLTAACTSAPISFVAADCAAFTALCPDLRGSAHPIELIQRIARLHPLAVQWWDYSGEIPIYRFCLRGSLTPLTLARSTLEEPITLAPLWEKQLNGVWIDYVYTNAAGQRISEPDSYGSGPFTGPNSLRCSIPVGTDSAADGAANASLAYEAHNYGVARLLQEAFATVPWAGTLTAISTTAPLPAVHPSQALNISGGAAAWGTMAAQVQSTTRTIGETCDRMSIELGCGEHLGPADYLALCRAGGVSGGAAGGHPSPYSPPRKPGSGTYDDLMPGGPAGGYTPAFALEDEAKGDDLQVLGIAEYVDASDPTRYYLTETLAGGSTADTWGGAGWTHRTNTISGGNTVDPATGAVTSTKACREVFVSELLPSENSDTTKHGASLCAEDGAAPGSTPTTTVTRTERQITVTGSAIDANHYTNAAGTATQSLGRENTEHDVIERAKASLEWATCNYSATAHYTARGALRSMPWQMLRRRAKTMTGLKPWGTYTLTFPTETCQQIAGAEWVAGPPKSVAVAADLDGKCAVTDWAELEAERGYSARWSTLITCTPQ